MKLILNFLPYPFLFKKINPNSIIFKIIKVFFCSFLISNSIYISFFENEFLNILSPFLSIWGLVLLLKSNSKEYFWIGFFVGLFWFWWVGLSCIYFDLTYLMPIIITAVCLVYAIMFRICHLLKFDFLRLSGIFCLSFIHPIGFDWLNFGILSVNGIFQANYIGTICIFLIAYFIYEKYISRYYKMAIILTIFFIGLQYEDIKSEDLNLNYKLVNTNINQDIKYIRENLIKNSNDLINEIKIAIKEKKELIVLPESAFAFDLQNSFDGYYENLLKELSNKITIITGAFSSKEDKIFNSTYIFKNENVYILNKYYLVPFGEEIPFLKDVILKYFLKNIEEFSKDKKLNIYKLNNQTITNAICYEATKENLYKNKNIIIAISNNAWFKNSSQYLLQNLLIKFYASKYGVNVYHSTNSKQTKLIKPKESLIKKYKLKLKALIKGF